jgi:hypothetical protein
MKSDSSVRSNRRPSRRRLIYVRSLAEIPDFKSDDGIAAWYQTHSTVLTQDQLETIPAKVGGRLRERLFRRPRATDGRGKHPHPRPPRKGVSRVNSMARGRVMNRP